MNQLDIEASWVLKNLISENLIDETDTAVIFQSFNHVFPNFDGAIKFNDGLRNDDLMTLCVMH